MDAMVDGLSIELQTMLAGELPGWSCPRTTCNPILLGWEEGEDYKLWAYPYASMEVNLRLSHKGWQVDMRDYLASPIFFETAAGKIVAELASQTLPFERPEFSPEEKQKLLAAKPCLLALAAVCNGSVGWHLDLAKFCLDGLASQPQSPRRVVRQFFFTILAAELEPANQLPTRTLRLESLGTTLGSMRQQDDRLPHSPLFPYRRVCRNCHPSPSFRTEEEILAACGLESGHQRFLQNTALEQIVAGMGLFC